MAKNPKEILDSITANYTGRSTISSRDDPPAAVRQAIRNAARQRRH